MIKINQEDQIILKASINLKNTKNPLLNEDEEDLNKQEIQKQPQIVPNKIQENEKTEEDKKEDIQELLPELNKQEDKIENLEDLEQKLKLLQQKQIMDLQQNSQINYIEKKVRQNVVNQNLDNILQSDRMYMIQNDVKGIKQYPQPDDMDQICEEDLEKEQGRAIVEKEYSVPIMDMNGEKLKGQLLVYLYDQDYSVTGFNEFNLVQRSDELISMIEEFEYGQEKENILSLKIIDQEKLSFFLPTKQRIILIFKFLTFRDFKSNQIAENCSLKSKYLQENTHDRTININITCQNTPSCNLGFKLQVQHLEKIVDNAFNIYTQQEYLI
ncbi:hypothetical protein IMG5_001000 [Ichthyophthirius multifiliis]|uniref:Uncharacterized protein n=1 Tax=Ichthyophthirius multifiliis TaxID=5932 RepID=G0QIY6_ICHMU|nr:hypothetical protein IMG5_001000 [Ichthyophthirius multifiliis]EGR34871.1 hypothetical protein IMG5_001000 [Ichthyophthirius multifiliis]|eukprot:XP_004040175.1 hypothetical protein IMG5_001000 [Ichthyophthirius multifiliis]